MSSKRDMPKPGQESVWDYPRPPRVEVSPARIRVLVGGVTIAESTHTKRVLETSHPPVYYIPPGDIETDCLIPTKHRSFCEWKGQASYYTVVVPGRTIEQAGSVRSLNKHWPIQA